MKEKIEQLIQHHKLAKQECWELINELRAIGETSLTEDEAKDLNRTIEKYSEEYSWRGVFISDLEDLL